MSHLSQIYDAWDGNAAAMAADIGESDVLTRQWRARGNIPPKYWPRIIEAAEAKGVSISWRMFIAPNDDAETTLSSGRASSFAGQGMPA